MPEANHYLHQAGVVLSLSLGTSNPIVAAKLREIAEEYLARAVKLRIDRGLPPLPRSSASPSAPPARHASSTLNRLLSHLEPVYSQLVGRISEA